MKELNEMTLTELDALIANAKAQKATLKQTAKDNKAANETAVTDKVNSMIADGTLAKGMKITVDYNGNSVVGEIVGVLSTEKASITVESVDFKSTKPEEEGNLKRRYIKKAKFLGIVED